MKSLVLLVIALLSFSFVSFSQTNVTGVVVSVESGDSFTLRVGKADIPIKLRMIEAPVEEQPLFEVARDHLSSFILGKPLTVSYSTYSGSRAYVGDIELSQRMLRDGAAWFLQEGSRDAQYEEIFKANEAAARTEERGIWAVHGLGRPSEMRKLAESSSEPMADPRVAALAVQMFGSSVEDVFAREIYSLESGDCGGTVVGVIDGDTVDIRTSSGKTVRVRLEGIDAPEKGQACGMRSKQALSDQIFGRAVSCNSSKRDRYGRMIGKISLAGVDINKRMISIGYAWHYKSYASEQPVADRASYANAEVQARGSSAGLWKDCDRTPPWEYRRNRFTATFLADRYDAASVNTGGYYSPSSPGSGGGPVNVKGYRRSNGTYVQPHTRSAPGSRRP